MTRAVPDRLDVLVTLAGMVDDQGLRLLEVVAHELARRKLQPRRRSTVRLKQGPDLAKADQTASHLEAAVATEMGKPAGIDAEKAGSGAQADDRVVGHPSPSPYAESPPAARRKRPARGKR